MKHGQVTTSKECPNSYLCYKMICFSIYFRSEACNILFAFNYGKVNNSDMKSVGEKSPWN